MQSVVTRPATLTMEHGLAFAIPGDKQEGERYYAQIVMFSASEMRKAQLPVAHARLTNAIISS